MLLLISCSCFAQEDIFNHEWWEAVGSHTNQGLGIGLDTVGYLNDSIPDAVTIGADGSLRYVWNRTKLDTTPHYEFPGSVVVSGDINGDGKKDFVVWNSSTQTITVLFGTDIINEFDTELVLHGKFTQQEFVDVGITIANVDSTHYDGIIITDGGYTTDTNAINRVGRILYYKGGAQLSQTPDEIIYGTSKYDIVGGAMALGHVRDKYTEYLNELRVYGQTAKIFLYPIGKNFDLRTPADTITLQADTDQGGFTGGYLIDDADADGIDDIILGSYAEVLIYRGGDSISPQVTYRLHPPHLAASFARKIIDAGDITGRGYHTLVVNYPTDSYTGYMNGAVFLYNMGKALKDSCVAAGYGPVGFDDYFGTSVIPLSKIDSSNIPGFMVGRAEGSAATLHTGAVTAFYGDTSYGPMVGLREDGSIPVVFSLSQNYPNPSSGETTIDFSVLDPRLYGSSVTVTLYSEYGEKAQTLYRGMADNIIRALHIDTETLPSGNYFYRLTCGGREETRMMSIMR